MTWIFDQCNSVSFVNLRFRCLFSAIPPSSWGFTPAGKVRCVLPCCISIWMRKSWFWFSYIDLNCVGWMSWFWCWWICISHSLFSWWFVRYTISGVSQAAVRCVCVDGKEMLTKLTWSHSGNISYADLLKITVKYPTCDLSLVLSDVSLSVTKVLIFPHNFFLIFFASS